MFNRKVEHDVRYYWDNHMSASFMVDHGPAAARRDRCRQRHVVIGHPHNESTFGYSQRSIKSVVDAVGQEAAVKMCSTNIKKFLGV